MQCIKCGAEVVVTTGGNYHCTRCGQSINDLVYRPSNCEMSLPEGFGAPKGWICPVCGRGLSPWTTMCPCRSNGFEITYGTGIGIDDITCLNSNGDSQSTATNIDSEWNKYSTNTEGK